MKLCEFLKVSHVNVIDLVLIHDNKVTDSWTEKVFHEYHLVGHQISEYADCGWEITAIYMGDNGCLQIVCDKTVKKGGRG